MYCKEVKTKEEEAVFLRFPRVVYQDDPQWIPHLESDIKKVFDPKQNKLLREGKAIRWIAFDQNNNPLGRIAAFINPKTVDWNGIKVGGVGFFECIDNQSVANLLFDSARKWLVEHGMQAADGPINLGERDAFWGVLVHGYTEPMYRANYNPKYYESLFQNYGFQLFFKQYTYYRNTKDPLSSEIYERAQKILNNQKIVFKKVDKKLLPYFGKAFQQIYNEAWGNHLGVGAMTEVRAQSIMKTIKPLIDERLMWFAFEGERPIAFSIMLPDINTLLKKHRGKWGIWQKMQLLWDLKRSKATRIFGVIFGVVPDFQKMGMESALAVTLEKEGLKDPHLNYQSLEMNWIGDFNPKMMKVAEMVGGKIFKEHRTLRIIFDDSIDFEREKIIQ
jgi:hypothetical protein